MLYLLNKIIQNKTIFIIRLNHLYIKTSQEYKFNLVNDSSTALKKKKTLKNMFFFSLYNFNPQKLFYKSKTSSVLNERV